MIEIGDKVRFRPAANEDKSAGFPDVLAVEVTGTVVMVNEAHGWYRARYELPSGGVSYECFPLPVEAEPEPVTGHAYRRAFEGGVRPMGQAYGNKRIP